MRKTNTIVLLASLGLLSACGASSSTDGAVAASSAASPITTSLDNAWAKAKAGENPSTTCAKVKGYAISNDSSSARAALAQCNFDIPVRYFNALLDDVDTGKLSCAKFMTTMSTQLSALTLSVGGLKQAARKRSHDASASADASTMLNAVLTSDSAMSAKDQVKAALAPRAIAACPIMKAYMTS